MSNNTNSRIALYKEAMVLEGKRAALQTEIDRLAGRLTAIKSQLFGAEVSATPVLTVASKVRRTRKSAGRGELKAKILHALVAAGDAGARIKDLAKALGAKSARLHSWFQSAVKRIPQIKKIGEAHYRVEGELPPIEEAKRARKSVPAKGGKRRKTTRPLSGRGELASKIIGALQEADAAGIKVGELAAKLGVKKRNLFIWFATTGKKNKAITKVGSAHYRLENNASRSAD